MALLTVGQIVNTFGVQGELKIVSFSHFSNKRYHVGSNLLLKNEITNEEKQVTVSSYRVHKGLDLVKFIEIDATTATRYFSWYVLAEKEDIKLPRDTYFHVDLIGCLLIDEMGIELGKVIEVVDYGAHPILKVKTLNEEKTFQVPFIPPFIIKVDIKNKKITIRPIDGLL